MSHLQINIMNFMAAKHRKRVEYGSQAQLDNIQEAYSALMNGTEVEKSANFELFTYCSNLNNKVLSNVVYCHRFLAMPFIYCFMSTIDNRWKTFKKTF